MYVNRYDRYRIQRVCALSCYSSCELLQYVIYVMHAEVKTVDFSRMPEDAKKGAKDEVGLLCPAQFRGGWHDPSFQASELVT